MRPKFFSQAGAGPVTGELRVQGWCEAWAGPVTGELRVLGWCEAWAGPVTGEQRCLGWAAAKLGRGWAASPALPKLIGYKPLAFRKVEASGCFIPVKSVNISMGSLVLPRLMILSRKDWPTAGSRAPCLAK